MPDVVWRWPGSDQITDRVGQCYTMAMEAVLANQQFGNRLFLVHGLLHADRSSRAELFTTGIRPPSNPHAWIEIEVRDGVMAFDPVLRLCNERVQFYGVFGCEVIRRYRFDVAVSIAARRKSYGPWDRASLTQWEERQRFAREHPEWNLTNVIARFLADDRG